MAADSPFGFVQFEVAFPLGPADGRYLRRASEGGEPERVVVLRTLDAPPRRGRRSRRAKPAADGTEPQPVPTVRATLIGAEAFESSAAAEGWLESLRTDADARESQVAAALAELNAVLRAHRAAAADPYVREIARWHANVIRVGHGSGQQVADGRWTAAYEVPEPHERLRLRRGEGIAPQERLAAMLGGSEQALLAEELVLRARLDIDAGRLREAALQARIALEALLAEMPDSGAVADHRDAVARAANAALEGHPPPDVEAALIEALVAMRRAIAAAASDAS